MEESYADALKELGQRHYKSVRRYSGKPFLLSKLKTKSSVKQWKEEDMFQEFDRDKNGLISPEELRRGVRNTFGLRLKQGELDSLCKEEITLQSEFDDVICFFCSFFALTNCIYHHDTDFSDVIYQCLSFK